MLGYMLSHARRLGEARRRQECHEWRHYQGQEIKGSHPLWRFENMTITPHNAGHSPAHWDRLADIIARNVRRLDDGDVSDLKTWFDPRRDHECASDPAACERVRFPIGRNADAASGNVGRVPLHPPLSTIVGLCLRPRTLCPLQ